MRERATKCRDVLLTVGGLLLMASTAWADDPPKIDTGDTAWMLTSSALVLMMTAPGLALFYGGLVRRKNALGTIMQSFIMMAVIAVQWILFGYTLAFGPDVGDMGLIGGLDWLGTIGVGAEPNTDYAPTIPHQAFMIYQCMFAVITPALISGALADRMKFSAYLLFTLLWSTLIYDPLAHWVWGFHGWMGLTGTLKSLDFAGGTVVHISSGVAALVGAIMIGKRRGYPHENMMPHSLPLAVTGAAMLWVGWFGFNAGSALGANGLAVSAFVATNTAAAAATLGWMVAEWARHGKPTVLGAASGAVAGLVVITPAAGFVTPLSAIVMGFVGGVICFNACSLKHRLGYDDSLDVVGVHFVGGTTGAILTGIFATTSVNAAGADGLLYGNPGQLVTQLISVGVTILFGGIGAAILYKVVDLVIGLRAEEEDESLGLDLSQHGEQAYTQ